MVLSSAKSRARYKNASTPSPGCFSTEFEAISSKSSPKGHAQKLLQPPQAVAGASSSLVTAHPHPLVGKRMCEVIPHAIAVTTALAADSARIQVATTQQEPSSQLVAVDVKTVEYPVEGASCINVDASSYVPCCNDTVAATTVELAQPGQDCVKAAEVNETVMQVRLQCSRLSACGNIMSEQIRVAMVELSFDIISIMQ